MAEELISFVEGNYFLIGYGITLVISLIYYQRYYDTVLKYFPIIILFAFLCELLGYLLSNYSKYSFFEDIEIAINNEVVYNIYAVLSFSYFYGVYRRLISNSKYKAFIFNAWLFVIASYILSCFFQNPLEIQLFYATSFGSWVLVCCILIYFKDKKLQNSTRLQPYNLMFWVSLGLFLFYSVLPILQIIGYNDTETYNQYHLRTVLHGMIVITYTLFTVGFVKGRRQCFG